MKRGVRDHDDHHWWTDDDHDPGYDPAEDWLDTALADFERSTDAHRPMVTPDEITDGDGPDPELDQFLAEPEPDYDWLIPDILERGDRVILTGGEGAGKSTLLRQIGVQCASGIHPFTHATIKPGAFRVASRFCRGRTRRRCDGTPKPIIGPLTKRDSTTKDEAR